MSLLSKFLHLDHQAHLLSAINTALSAIAHACGLPATEDQLHTDLHTALSAATSVAVLTGGQRIVGLVNNEIDRTPLSDAAKSTLKTVAADTILNGVAQAGIAQAGIAQASIAQASIAQAAPSGKAGA